MTSSSPALRPYLPKDVPFLLRQDWSGVVWPPL